MANLQEKPFWEPGIYQLETSDPVLAGPDGIDNLQGKQLANRTVHLKERVDKLESGEQPSGNAAKLSAARKIEATGDGSWNVVFDGSRDVSGQLTLRDSGVAPGSYGVVTVDGKGRVIAGRQMTGDDVPAHDWSRIASGKPTTLAGYGIVDGASKGDLQSAVNGLVSGAPANLNTLQELAAALNNDAKYSATVDGKLAAKADKAVTLAGYGIVDGITVDRMPRKNLVRDSGRFIPVEAVYDNPTAAIFSCQSAMAPLTAPDYQQSVTITNAGKFIHDNTSNGGGKGELAIAVKDLLAALPTRRNFRYGSEFYIAEFSCGNLNYSPDIVDGIRRCAAAAYGVVAEGNITFMAWLRCTRGSIRLDVTSYKNGKPASNPIIVPADGWVHCAGITNWDGGYSISHIRAEDNSVFQVAMTVALSGNHLGYVHQAPISF
ncbi:hypothetical protein [Chromobacterium sp. CV08]|uniref:hypothetical protein n=1 Tax=Chromobacterium sp. CV08 TaxID=3133274 RepID=UPI003DA7D072